MYRFRTSHIASAIVFVVYTVAFLVIGGLKQPMSAWISYAFIVLSFICVIALESIIEDSEGTLAISTRSIPFFYFIAEIIIATIISISKPTTVKGPFIFQLIIFGIFVIFMLFILDANKKTTQRAESRASEIGFIKQNVKRVRVISTQCDNKKIKDSLGQLCDLIQSSPSKSDAICSSIEETITNKIIDLERRLGTDSQESLEKSIKEVIALVEARNNMVN